MGVVLSVLQSAYFAWGVAIVVLAFAISRAKTNGEKYKNQINAIREETAEEIRKANAQSTELVRQTKAQCDVAIRHERETAIEAINRERALSAEKIRLLQEQIEADKTSIMRKTEKEILADITISLGGFARRIERVESKLTPIEQEMELIVDKVDNIGVSVSDAQFHL